ncbi:hypothetical protein GCM10023215_23910 [Pseudonocardia yuanmonensis]|uniref:Dentin sialophosphoprotein n=1 Tax=Pseudonocardia yuanmonensis TaxID=1095914 RepID=A0ABP8WF24_9PSEU
MTLLEFLLKLIGNDEESLDLQQDFREDPYGTLKDAGLEDLTAEDVHDALVLIQDNDTASFDRNYDTGSNHLVAAAAAPHHGGHHEGDHDGHKGAVEYINKYVTNNYVDDNDTIVDNSVNQKIDTDGGDFEQEIDIDAVTASGDGAVAAGGDIEDSVVTTGDDNIVGDDNNVVNGDNNTTAFGSGNANSASFEDVSVEEGGALSVGGNATGDYDVSDSYNSVSNETNTSVDIDDSYNQDNDVSFESESESYEETNTTIDTETNVLSNNEVDVEVS